MDDINDSGSDELRALNDMNNSKLWTIWKILSLKLKALGVMNNKGLWII